MATPGEMIKIAAIALALPIATVTSYHRVLREEGLVTKGGRGRSAPTMSAEDVAKLLIILMGADNLEDAGAACRMLIEMSSSGIYDAPDGELLVPKIPFLDAVVILLQQAKGLGSDSKPPPLPGLGWFSRNVVFEISSSILEATIVDGGNVLFFQYLADVPISYPEDWAELSVEDRILARAQIGGMLIKRSVDWGSLMALSAALPS